MIKNTLTRLVKSFFLLKIHKSIYKPGHYYSPIPDLDDLKKRENELFGAKYPVSDIKTNENKQVEIFNQFLNFKDEFPYTETKKKDDYLYYKDNIYFTLSDAFYLYSFMRNLQPKRIIEIGSGFSSAVMIDINTKFLQEKVNLTFIEPYPDRLYSLVSKVKEKVEIVVEKVQNVDLKMFETLNEGDFLFVDSTHVLKIGSDVNHIFYNILPILKPGVIIHFHDIFWPFEYPKEWVFEGRFWNELYILRAFLMNNNDYEILFFNDFFSKTNTGLLNEKLPLGIISGGSIYLIKK